MTLATYLLYVAAVALLILTPGPTMLMCMTNSINHGPRRATERVQSLQREADKLTADERTLLGDLRKLEIDRQIKAEELRQIAADGGRVAEELMANQRRTQELEAQEADADLTLLRLRARIRLEAKEAVLGRGLIGIAAKARHLDSAF